MIGKIERVPLRDVWKHEALDFTTWLEENVDVLNDVIDLNLISVEREQRAGAFSVDLVGEDDTGNVVIIENQLEKSDHDHLGKLITYLTAMEARAAIWIVADPRPEHVKAIAWLNETSAASFYLLKLEAIAIGESEPAPLLTLIVGPSEEAREVGHTKREMAERVAVRQQFWAELLDRAKATSRLHAHSSPSRHQWVGTGAGVAGLQLNYVVRLHDGQVEMYIDRGKDSAAENQAIFDWFFQRKAEIESAFGGPLSWERLEHRQACRIRKVIDLGGYDDDETKWPAIQDAMIDAMIRLEKALRPHLKALKI